MKLRPKTLRVYPNPWGVPPRSIFDIEDAEKAKAKDSKVHVPSIDPSTVTIDHNGIPCGVCPLDKYEHSPGSTGAMGVGAVIQVDKTRVTQLLEPGDDQRSAMQKTVWAFMTVDADDPSLPKKLTDEDAVQLPHTAYYVERLQHGELVAADEETARVAGIPFEDPKKLIPRLADAAIKAWNLHFEGVDGGAFAHFQKERPFAQFDADAAASVKRELSKTAQPAKTAGREDAK
jgi:hypothetical protein